MLVLGAAAGAGITAAVLIGPLHYRPQTVSAPVTTASRSTATPTSSASTAAASTPSNSYFNGALDFGVHQVEQKTGLTYASSGCAAGQGCLTHAVETDGENAAYIGVDAHSYAGGSTCYAYVHSDPLLGWQETFPVVCGNGTGFAPVYGETDSIRVNGGCANVRNGPGLNTAIVGCLTNGTSVKIDATPSFIDNKMWWGVVTDQVSGFMSQEFLVG